MLTFINPDVFIVARIILFFFATIYIYKAMQAVDLNRFFRRNSGDQIRFLFMVVAIIMGYLFVDALMSLFEWLNGLL